MFILEAAILGAVQGLTEFLPVSSSGHLLIAPPLLGWSQPFLTGLTLSVALHLGTAIALGLTLWRDWWWLIRGVLGWGVDAPIARRVLAGIVISTALVGAVALPFKDLFESTRTLWIVGSMLVSFGLLLAIADRFGSCRWSFQSTKLPAWILVGTVQLAALVPGVSRSGVAITAARSLGIERSAGVRYALLLLAPIVLGAGLIQLGDASREGELATHVAPLIAGTATASLVGSLAIRAVLWFAATRGLMVFAVYRVVLGTAILIALSVGALS